MSDCQRIQREYQQIIKDQQVEIEQLKAERAVLIIQRDAANDEANRLSGYDRWANQVDPRPDRHGERTGHGPR